MSAVVAYAPAKINLTLDVFPPREDGYHELDSLVAVLAYPCDELKITVRPGKRGVRLLCKSDEIPRDSRNHAVRAAEIFLERFIPDEEATLWINLAKRLPIQAGLGGGSSDAAAVLAALSRIYPNKATKAALSVAAAEIGSDVPLFLEANGSGVVRMRGRGEKTEKVATHPPIYGILVKPDEGAATKDAYAALDCLEKRTPGAATPALQTALERGIPTEELARYLSNDFNAAASSYLPSLTGLLSEMQDAGALAAILCGSGSCVFGLSRDPAQARELARRFVGRYPWVKIADMPGGAL